jgi:hypothetical protein
MAATAAGHVACQIPAMQSFSCRSPGNASRTAFHQNVDEMKSMDSLARPGANHSDTSWYREDLQRRMASEDAISCQRFGGTQY